MITFTAEKHEYKSIEPDGIDWLSATSVVGYFKGDFDPATQAIKSSKNKNSKWFGMSPSDIRQAWENEAKRATDLGTWYHNQRENDLCGLDNIGYKGQILPIFKPREEEGVKYAPSQRLVKGCYPELLVYLKSMGVCGQSDKVDVYNNIVDISDYKTNKEIKKASYVNWEGISSKMKAPLQHLDDCNFYHYALQLSLYLYIILKHNPGLKPGKLTMQHVIFEENGRDQFDYPVTKLNKDGDPIIKDIVYYDLPYLKDEVVLMLNYAKLHRDEIRAYKEYKEAA